MACSCQRNKQNGANRVVVKRTPIRTTKSLSRMNGGRRIIRRQLI